MSPKRGFVTAVVWVGAIACGTEIASPPPHLHPTPSLLNGTWALEGQVPGNSLQLQLSVLNAFVDGWPNSPAFGGDGVLGADVQSSLERFYATYSRIPSLPGAWKNVGRRRGNRRAATQVATMMRWANRCWDKVPSDDPGSLSTFARDGASMQWREMRFERAEDGVSH